MSVKRIIKLIPKIQKDLAQHNQESMQNWVEYFKENRIKMNSLLKNSDLIDIKSLSDFYLLIGKLMLSLSQTMEYRERMASQALAKECYKNLDSVLSRIPSFAFPSELAGLQTQVHYNLHELSFEYAKAVLDNPASTIASCRQAQQAILNFKSILDNHYKDDTLRKKLKINHEFLKSLVEVHNDLGRHPCHSKLNQLHILAAISSDLADTIEAVPLHVEPNIIAPVEPLVGQKRPLENQELPAAKRENNPPSKMPAYKRNLMPWLIFFGTAETPSLEKQLRSFQMALEMTLSGISTPAALNCLLKECSTYLSTKFPKKEIIPYLLNSSVNLDHFIAQMKDAFAGIAKVDEAGLDEFTNFVATVISSKQLLGKESTERAELFLQLYSNNSLSSSNIAFSHSS